MTGVHNYLKSTRFTMPETDLVLMIDGFDVLVQLPAEHLVKRFRETSQDWPDDSGLVITAADKG